MLMGKTCNCDCTRCKPLCIAYAGGYSIYRYASEKSRAIGLRHILNANGRNIAYSYACLIKHNRGGANNDFYS